MSDKKQMKLYQVDINNQKFQKDHILEISYQVIKEQKVTIYQKVLSSGSLRDVYLVILNENNFVAKTPKLQYGYRSFD